MNRVKWERFKFYTLIALILASLLQVGILLSYQYRGFPNYFFSGFLKDKNSLNYKDEKDSFFQPSRIVFSEGEDESHWVIDKENKFYTTLFNDAKLYLGNILRMEMVKDRHTQPLDQTKIEDLAGKYFISFEFKADISRDLMAFFLNIKDISNNEISSIKKILILPSEDPNSNCTIEIIDEQNKKIHEYIMPFDITGKKEEYYKILTNELSKDANLIDYKLFNEFKIQNNIEGLKFSSDLLLVASHKYNMYNMIDCYPPKEFEIGNTENTDKLELVNLALTVLEDQKDIYVPSVDIYGAAVFKNTDSTYKVYKDGLMEYRYFPPSKEETEKGNIADSYIRALNFINSRSSLVAKSGAKIFLSGLKEQKDSYKFTFDYRVADLPVFMAYKAKDKGKSLFNDKEPLKNAIEIEATGSRILSCRWVFKNFTIKDKKNYSMYFLDMLENLEYKPTDKNSILDIRNIEVCYKVTGDKLTNIEPVWKLETAGAGAPYTVTMPRK